MNTTTTQTQEETIGRIAGRMVHRATDAKAFLISIEGQIAGLNARDLHHDPGRDIKLEDFEERRVRLARAIGDYEKAEKMIRAFPALLLAAQDFEAMSSLAIDSKHQPARSGLARDAIRKAEEAIK